MAQLSHDKANTIPLLSAMKPSEPANVKRSKCVTLLRILKTSPHVSKPRGSYPGSFGNL